MAVSFLVVTALSTDLLLLVPPRLVLVIDDQPLVREGLVIDSLLQGREDGEDPLALLPL